MPINKVAVQATRQSSVWNPTLCMHNSKSSPVWVC